MKLYEIVFADPDVGFVRRFERNKRTVDKRIAAETSAHPLRKMLTVEQIEIPSDKQGFIAWLNKNATRACHESTR